MQLSFGKQNIPTSNKQTNKKVMSFSLTFRKSTAKNTASYEQAEGTEGAIPNTLKSKPAPPCLRPCEDPLTQTAQ